jgi:hypothetical protein
MMDCEEIRAMTCAELAFDGGMPLAECVDVRKSVSEPAAATLRMRKAFAIAISLRVVHERPLQGVTVVQRNES